MLLPRSESSETGIVGVLDWVNIGGVSAGIAIMYATALMVS